MCLRRWLFGSGLDRALSLCGVVWWHRVVLHRGVAFGVLLRNGREFSGPVIWAYRGGSFVDDVGCWGASMAVLWVSGL